MACDGQISHDKKSVYFPDSKVHDSKTLPDIKAKMSGRKKTHNFEV